MCSIKLEKTFVKCIYLKSHFETTHQIVRIIKNDSILWLSGKFTWTKTVISGPFVKSKRRNKNFKLFFYITAAYNSLKTWLAPAVPLLMVRFCGTTPNSTSLGNIMDEGTIKTPSPICRLYWCLIEFIDWRYSQSCWYFRPLLWTALSICLQICYFPRPMIKCIYL